MSGKSVFFINNQTQLLGYRISIISIRYPTIRFVLIVKVKISIYRFFDYRWHPYFTQSRALIYNLFYFWDLHPKIVSRTWWIVCLFFQARFGPCWLLPGGAWYRSRDELSAPASPCRAAPWPQVHERPPRRKPQSKDRGLRLLKTQVGTMATEVG